MSESRTSGCIHFEGVWCEQCVEKLLAQRKAMSEELAALRAMFAAAETVCTDNEAWDHPSILVWIGQAEWERAKAAALAPLPGEVRLQKVKP